MPEDTKIIRIIGTDLKGDNRLEVALRKIKGINWSFARAVRNALNVPSNTKLQDLSNEQIEKMIDIIKNPKKYGIPTWLYNRRKDIESGEDKHIVGGEIDLTHKLDIKRLIEMRCYRGFRHMFHYKVRGQKTRSHGANQRGRIGIAVGVAKVKKKLKK